jgi:hypothetical protein
LTDIELQIDSSIMKFAVEKFQRSPDLFHWLNLHGRDQKHAGLEFGERKDVVDDALLMSNACHDGLGTFQSRFNRRSIDRDLLSGLAQ